MPPARSCSATDLVVRGECEDRVLRGASAGPSCRARPRDGLLPLQQRRRRRRACARGARPRARRDRRLRRASRQRHRGHLRRRPARADGRHVPASALSVLGRRAAAAPNMVNVPLAPGSGSDAFRAAVREHWLPALEAHRPQLHLISAGFDAHREDPLAGLKLTDADYAWVTRELIAGGRAPCAGPHRLDARRRLRAVGARPQRRRARARAASRHDAARGPRLIAHRCAPESARWNDAPSSGPARS